MTDEDLGPGDQGDYLLSLVRVRQEIETLRQLRGEALIGYMMNCKWFAQEDDLIGGWCVVPIEQPPSSGVFTIANFMDERSARHIAWLHNQWNQTRRQGHAGLPDLPPDAMTSSEKIYELVVTQPSHEWEVLAAYADQGGAHHVAVVVRRLAQILQEELDH